MATDSKSPRLLAIVVQVDVWQMADCWIDADDFKASGKEPCKKGKLTSATNITAGSKYGEGRQLLGLQSLHDKGNAPSLLCKAPQILETMYTNNHIIIFNIPQASHR